MKIKLNKTMRITSAVLASALVITTVSGCSLFPKKEVQVVPKVITIWGFESEDLWQPIIKDPSLQEELGGFEIRYVKKTLTDTYENDSLNSILAGQGPDVWAIPNDWVYRHKEKLSAAPENLVAQLGTGLVPSAYEANVINDNVYGYSPGVDTLMLYYNEKALEQASIEFEKTKPKQGQDEDGELYNNRPDIKEFERKKALINQPPKIWSDFIEAVKLITAKNGTEIVRSGFAAGTSTNTAYATDIVYSLMLQNKVKMTSDDLSLATFNLPINTASGENDVSGKYVLDFYTQFANPNSPYYSWNATMGNNLDAFANNKVAYVVAPASAASYFSQKYPNFSYRNFSMPQISDKEEDFIAFGRFYSYVIPRLSNYPLQAWTVAARAPLNGATQESSKANPNYKEGKDQIKMYQANVSHVWTKGRYPVEIDKIFRNIIEDVLGNKQSSENAVNTAATKVTDLLRKSEW